MAASQDPVLFKALVTERHWQRFETFRAQFRRSAVALAETLDDRQILQADVSRRQFDRWLSGEVRTAPRPLQCMVLEHLLEKPVSTLFRREVQAVPAAGREDGPHTVAPADAASSALEHATTFATEFMLEQDVQVGARARDELFDHVQHLCRSYPSRPANTILPELTAAQQRILSACRTERRGLLSIDLYFLGGVSSALVAKASQDLGYLSAARRQARVAAFCAEAAGHQELQAWIKGLESIISYWAGDHRSAAEKAMEGQSLLRSRAGSVSSWLPALEARARALAENRNEVITAVERSKEARLSVDYSDLDSLGGLLYFSKEKHDYYNAEAWVLANGNDADAVTHAERAVGGLERGATAAFSDVAGARATLALAHAHQGETELAASALRPVLALDQTARIHGIVKSVERVGNALEGRGRKGDDTRASIAEFTSRTALEVLS